MTTTAHLQVYDAFASALAIAPALADVPIKTMRDPRRPMPDNVPAQVRVCIDHTLPTALVGGGAPVDWETRIRIDCTARDQPGTTSALDAATVLAAQCQAIVLADAVLQERVSEILPAPMQWAEDVADTALITCQAVFTLVHRSPFNFTA